MTPLTLALAGFALPAGLVVTSGLQRSPSSLARAGTALLAGLATVAAAAHAVICAGIPGRIALPAVVILVNTGAVLHWRRRARSLGEPKPSPAPIGPLRRMLMESLAVVVVAAGVAGPASVAMETAVHAHDAVYIWCPKAVRVLGEAPPDLGWTETHYHPEYPRGLAVLTAGLAGGTTALDPRVPRLVPLLLFGLLLLSLFDALASRGNLIGAVLLPLVVAALPAAAYHAVSGYADLPLAAFLALAAIGLADDDPAGNGAPLAIAGAVGAFVTKDEGTIPAAVVITIALARLVRARRLAHAASAALFVAAVVGSWLARKSGAETRSTLLLPSLAENAGFIGRRIGLFLGELGHAFGLSDPSPDGPTEASFAPLVHSLLPVTVGAFVVTSLAGRNRFRVLPFAIALLASCAFIIVTPDALDWQFETAFSRLLLQVAPAVLLPAVDRLTRVEPRPPLPAVSSP